LVKHTKRRKELNAEEAKKQRGRKKKKRGFNTRGLTVDCDRYSGENREEIRRGIRKCRRGGGGGDETGQLLCTDGYG